jgi:hypothetical protein
MQTVRQNPLSIVTMPGEIGTSLNSRVECIIKQKDRILLNFLDSIARFGREQFFQALSAPFDPDCQSTASRII